MSDVLGGLFEGAAGAIGQALSPAGPALDFLGLGASDPAGRDDPSGLIQALGRGVQDAVMAGPAGLAAGAAAAAQPNVSARDRLLLGGLLLAGAVPAGRAAYSRWKASSATRPRLPLPEEHMAQTFSELRGIYPTLGERQLNIMAQPDSASRANALARFTAKPDVPDERLAAMAARLDEYEATGTDLASAYDWAGFDEFADNGLLPREIEPLYDDFRDGLFLPDEEWTKLTEFVRKSSDIELEVGLTGKLHSIQDNAGRPLPVVRYKPPPVGNVYLDPRHRQAVLATLNPRPQFEQAVVNIEELVRRGASEFGRTDPQTASIIGSSDTTSAEIYWGLDFGLNDYPSLNYELLDSAFQRAAVNLEPEFGPLSGPEIRDLATATWTDLRDPSRGGWAKGNPLRLKPNGEENSAFLAMIGAGNELPTTLSGITGESMPAKALTTEAGDLTLFVDDYDVTHAMETTRQADHMMRNMFPGPLGDDGVPRWMPGRALPLKSFDPIDAAVLDNPSSVVETMHSGSYPGFQPGDYIAFDHGGKVPPWAESANRMPGGAARDRAERATRRLSRVDLTDAETTRSALTTNAWAVFTDPHVDLIARLRADGLNPIPLRGGEGPAVLVFGDIAESYNPPYTHAGATARTPLVEWVVPTRSGERVALDVPDTAPPAGIPRISERVARYVYKVDQREAHQIARLAADLENTGASNLAVYSRQPLIDGFEVARERVYRGPAATVKVIRTADHVIGESNAVPVHVRAGSGLPTRSANVDPNQVVTDGIDFEDLGERVRLNVEAEGDLFRKLRDAAELAQVYGHDNVDVMFEGKRIPLFRPDKFPELRTDYEYGVEAPTTTRPPVPTDPNVNGVRVIQRFGPGARYRLSPEVQADISGALEGFLGTHPEVAEMWGLSWVSVDRHLHGKVKGGGYVAAANVFTPGSGIHLNEDVWLDEPKLRARVSESYRLRYTSAPGIPGLITHELGHIMAATIRLLETGKAGRIGTGGSSLFDEMAPKFARWTETPGALSGRAKVDLDEALAEAVADVLAGSGRFSASQEIYDTMTRHLNANLPKRQRFWGQVVDDDPSFDDEPMTPRVDDGEDELADLEGDMDDDLEPVGAY